MDAKILDAFNDLTKALDKVAEAVKDKTGAKSDATKLLQKMNNLDKKIDAINKGIQGVKKDTQQILKNQETLLRLSRDKKKPEVFEAAGDKKQKIKDGVNTVLMIAAGVLAIGVAFKLIGSVNFFSVIALSIALPLIAKSFEMISTMKLKKEDMKNIFFVVLTMATSIMVASWAFALIVPISIAQGLTAILIAGTFAVMSYGIEKITQGVKEVNLSDLKKVPIVMLTFGGSIALASWLMRLIIPITFQQGLTAILIAGAFTIMSYGIEKIAKGIQKITPRQALLMPLILIPFAAAVAASAWIFSKMVSVPNDKLWTAIGVAAALAIMSVSIPLIAYGVEKIGVANAALSALILPLLAIAIVGSAWAFTFMPKDLTAGQLFGAVGVALAIGISAIVLGAAAWFLAKVGLEALTEGAIGIVIVASALMLSSYLISAGNYTKYPSLDWAEGVGLSILAFGVAVAGLGFIAASGVGAIALLAGAAAVLGLAEVIVASSYILAQGTYKKDAYPSLEWASGVAKSLSAFGSVLSNMGLGGIALNIIGNLLGTGPEDIAQQIVNVDKKLSEGSFTKYPSLNWALSVSELMARFVSISSAQGFGDFLSDKLLGSGPEMIAKQIISVSEILSGGNYTNLMPANYVRSMSENIRAYVDLLNYLKSSNVNAFSVIDTIGVVLGLSMLSNSYDKLGKSIKNLSNSINSIDIQKLQALNMMSGNIVLMSLMDSDQFEKMMDALEEKAGIFVDSINMLQGEAEKSPISRLSTPGGKSDTSGQILNVLQDIKTNTAGLSNLAAIPAAIGGLATKLDMLIAELKHDTLSRKTKVR
jgi:hypothetical protein